KCGAWPGAYIMVRGFRSVAEPAVCGGGSYRPGRIWSGRGCACCAQYLRLPGGPSGQSGEARTAARRDGRKVGRRMSDTGSSLWARIEPVLARVEKPARYIGGE